MAVLAWWYYFLDKYPKKPNLLIKIVAYIAWIAYNISVRCYIDFQMIVIFFYCLI